VDQGGPVSASVRFPPAADRNSVAGWPVLASMNVLAVAGKASFVLTLLGGSALLLGLALVRWSQN
jgi:hypothetical protein